MKLNRRLLLASSAALALSPALAAKPIVKIRHRSNGIFAAKGEKTYCSNSCHIGTFGNTVQVGAMPKEGDLIPVREMYIGAMNCPFCSAPVCGGSGYYFFAT